MIGNVPALVREIINRVYPVGCYIDLATQTDPNTAIGCGTTWERITDGRALIASNDSHPLGWMGGVETVTLDENQIPKHWHSYKLNGGSETTEETALLNWGAGSSWQTWYTGFAGGGQAHENMQPSLAVNRWLRTA